MEFYDVLDQIIELLHSRGRVSYRALKRQFHLDDAFIEDVKEELLYAHPVVDDEGRGLIWTGDAGLIPEPAAAAPSASTPVSTPLAYTPQHLTEKILTSRSALEGERKQVTVWRWKPSARRWNRPGQGTGRWWPRSGRPGLGSHA